MVRWGRVCNVWMLHILSITMGWCIRVAGCALYQYLLRGWIWISKGWSAAICSKTSSALCYCSSSSNLKKNATKFSFLININEIFLQLQVKSKIKLVFVAKIVFVRCGKMYLQELEACRGEVEQVDNGFGRGFVSHPRRMVGRWIPWKYNPRLLLLCPISSQILRTGWKEPYCLL